jgi:hypothetical protein
MVKLDNWETKAEKAAERRTVSKQKKQQRDRTRMNKAMAQQLLSFLDEHNGRILLSCSNNGSTNGPSLKVHVWTDMTPSSFDWITFGPNHHYLNNNNNNNGGQADLADTTSGKKGRSRSGSLSSYPSSSSSPTTKKGRRPR